MGEGVNYFAFFFGQRLARALARLSRRTSRPAGDFFFPPFAPTLEKYALNAGSMFFFFLYLVMPHATVSESRLQINRRNVRDYV